MLKKLLWGGIIIGILLPSASLAEQKIIQQASTSATATGKNSFAASRVHQSAEQNRLTERNLQQEIEQQGESAAAAEGTDNIVVSDIYQESSQNQAVSNQQGTQTATSNAAATGRNNRIINNTGQYNRQNQWQY